ncbi:hypothetical protein [Komagataeibacter xylinus]|uniref:Uncharacterized protein n=1 Tax=Komagataeibacter xylinus TaxID=28448 RepID=A0A857FQ63_KOMXY|nr:hypothetical protein [Komagataeibacter xylinus]QHC36413.1 hypothetical protein FMA36_13710 [Komagataeibacter xylinus]
MNLFLSRRRALRMGAGTLMAGALAGCTLTRAGKITTITLNVAEVTDYGNAIVSFANTAISLSFVTAAMGPANVALANTVIAALREALDAFGTAAGSSTSVSYDTTSIRTAFDSILSDIEQINTLIIAVIAGMASGLSGTVVSEAKTTANAASTLISLLKAMVDMTARRPAVGTAVSAQEAVGQITVFVARHGA